MHPEGLGEIVLLVEDEEELREVIFTYLSLHGYTVLEAVNGEQALQIAREHGKPIHLLLTDIIMPKVSGTELARELAKKYPDLVTIYMSGYTNRAVVRPRKLNSGVPSKAICVLKLFCRKCERCSHREADVLRGNNALPCYSSIRFHLEMTVPFASHPQCPGPCEVGPIDSGRGWPIQAPQLRLSGAVCMRQPTIPPYAKNRRRMGHPSLHN